MSRPAHRPGRLAARFAAWLAGGLAVAGLAGALAAPAHAVSVVDDRSEAARRRAGPFDAALRRAQPPVLRGSAAPAAAGPMSLSQIDRRIVAALPARPQAATTGDWAAVALADADPLAQDAGDPLERLLRAHAVELADLPDAAGDPTGLAASGASVRLVALGPATGEPGVPRARPRAADAPAPAAVRIALDGRRTLAGHLFPPAGAGPHPAVVMLPAETGAHAGPGSARCQDAGSQPDGACPARTLAQRYLAWGRWWASQGVTALLIDSARAGGADAARAARWLRERDGIDGERVVMQGWGRAGRTVVGTALQGPPGQGERPAFRAGLALWPDCPPAEARAGAPAGPGTGSAPAPVPRVGFELLVLVAAREGEAVVERCAGWLEPAARAGGGIELVVFDDAGRGFDDPAARPAAGGRAEWRANRFAMQDAMRRAAAFVTRRTAASGTTAADGAAPAATPASAPAAAPAGSPSAAPATGSDRRD